MSYWLLPDQQSEAALERLSDCAQQLLNGCRLPPHITLYSDHLDSPHRASERLIAVADQQPPSGFSHKRSKPVPCSRRA